MDYNAKYFGDLFVSTARSETARRSYAKGISVGIGHIPYDTGTTQNSIYVSRASENGCTVEIGGDVAPYDIYLEYAENVGNTSVQNRHKGFVEKFARTEFVVALKEEFGKVKVS